MPNAWKLNGEAEALLARADQVAEKTIAPAAPAVDREARFPAGNIDALRSAGLLKLVSGKDAGGHGLGLRAAVSVAERIARECPSTAMIWIMHNCAAATIDKHGTPELRKAVAEGGKLATLAFSESGSRSHFWIPVGPAEKSGTNVKLNAAKQLITSAGACDLYVWSSKPAAAQGLSSIWAVPVNAAGLSIPAKYEGMGLRGNASAPITAKDVTIPASNLLGEDGKGFDVMMGIVMPFFSIQNCAVSLGMMEGAFARTIAHVNGSKFSYDGAAINSLPQVRGHVAKMRVKIDLLRGFLLDALDALEAGRADAMLRVLEAKVAGAETSLEVHDLAMRVCGGAAYRKDVGVERFFRDSRAATVMAPVSDALYEFIGKAVCGLPVFG
ncbi:MAG: acyl-CoA/acyl-ACP dehydrogenase [Planctomycetia bacterium]|nr:acyl-CoA/acyl-ACP dehydrogenase [Planctomycetia bacterium]